MINKILLYFKGVAIGMTDVVPGVSGATTAMLLGIYDRIIHEASYVTQHIKNKKWRELAPHLIFLVPILLGIATGLVIFAKIIQYLLLWWPNETRLAFVGLIIGSIPMIITRGNIRPLTIKKSIYFTLGSLLMISILIWDAYIQKQNPATDMVITHALPLITTAYLFRLFYVGLLVSVATALPGISGSLILLLLGDYYHVLAILNSWVDNLFQLNMQWHEFFALVSFAIGLGIGLFSYAFIISKLMLKHGEELFSFALGLILFSIIKVWPKEALTLAQILILTITAIIPLILARQGERRTA
ncbi:DUF368 domain-containing protein [Entomospira entomophila]|uniref:DUF368 domain-containing protein n=1 Tax=Entomospira entomophila TaxID=2719988 RepID=A0A968KVX3_9SPIO|nr:DUF368 domain-containing protein [Entomospira entomophilus]NIZ40275.1 DUF368 domain-containing protein [Entomospira entomophilus]WDI35834.1 DUF368 domain-containing protein [Entomospira entomophilus]